MTDYTESTLNGLTYQIDLDGLNVLSGEIFDPTVLFDTVDELLIEYRERRDVLAKTFCDETGYPISDCYDLVDVVLMYLESIEDFTLEVKEKLSCRGGGTYSGRNVSREQLPYGHVIAVTPGNATVPLAGLISISALAAGNAVTVRPSRTSEGSAKLLIEPLVDAFPESVNLLFADAQDVVRKDVLENFDVLHYTGSSRHYPSIAETAANAGTKLYVEGEGNGLFIVDSYPKEAASVTADALTRCNGQLCTTPSGLLISEEIEDEFMTELDAQLQKQVVGDPQLPDTDISDSLPKAPYPGEDSKILANEVAEIVPRVNGISEGELFGPYCWVDSWSSWETVEEEVRRRDHGLNITLFTDAVEERLSFREAPASRVCVNCDPTIQSPFSPWGALGASGTSPGNTFIEKFTRNVTVVESLDIPSPYEQ